MNNSDDMDIDSMVNNPFQYYIHEKSHAPKKSEIEDTESEDSSVTADSTGHEIPPLEKTSTDHIINRMNRNHPLDLRMLSLEKNQLNRDLKIDTIKQIIEHQNKRIELLENELDLLRKKKKEDV